MQNQKGTSLFEPKPTMPETTKSSPTSVTEINTITMVPPRRYWTVKYGDVDKVVDLLATREFYTTLKIRYQLSIRVWNCINHFLDQMMNRPIPNDMMSIPDPQGSWVAGRIWMWHHATVVQVLEIFDDDDADLLKDDADEPDVDDIFMAVVDKWEEWDDGMESLITQVDTELEKFMIEENMEISLE